MADPSQSWFAWGTWFYLGGMLFSGGPCLKSWLWSFRAGRDERKMRRERKEKLKAESRHQSTHEVVRHVWALWKKLR